MALARPPGGARGGQLLESGALNASAPPLWARKEKLSIPSSPSCPSRPSRLLSIRRRQPSLRREACPCALEHDVHVAIRLVLRQQQRVTAGRVLVADRFHDHEACLLYTSDAA